MQKMQLSQNGELLEAAASLLNARNCTNRTGDPTSFQIDDNIILQIISKNRFILLMDNTAKTGCFVGEAVFWLD